MLYWLAEWLGFPGALNLIRYLSFRSGAAVATALIIGLWIGPRFILMLRMRQGKGQPIRDDGPQSHLAKKGTPTMGGLMILISLMVSALLWMDLSNRFVWACLFVTGGFAAVGFLDPNLAGGGLHAGIAAQHPGDDFVGRQFRGRRGGQGVTEADQQEQGQGFALQFHRWPDAMTGVIQ